MRGEGVPGSSRGPGGPAALALPPVWDALVRALVPPPLSASTADASMQVATQCVQ